MGAIGNAEKGIESGGSSTCTGDSCSGESTITPSPAPAPAPSKLGEIKTGKKHHPHAKDADGIPNHYRKKKSSDKKKKSDKKNPGKHDKKGNASKDGIPNHYTPKTKQPKARHSKLSQQQNAVEQATRAVKLARELGDAQMLEQDISPCPTRTCW